MKAAIFALVGILSFWLSTTVFSFLRIGDSLFNMGTILAVVITVLYGARYGYISACTYSALVDVFASRLLGINLLFAVGVVSAVYFVSRELYSNSVTMPGIMIISATILYHIMYFLIMFFSLSLPPMEPLLKKIAIEIIYNLAVGYFIYYIMFKNVKGFRLGEDNV